MILGECKNKFGETDELINHFWIRDSFIESKRLQLFIRQHLNDNKPIITKKKEKELFEKFKVHYSMGIICCPYLHKLLSKLYDDLENVLTEIHKTA